MTDTTTMTAEEAVAAERRRCLSLIELQPNAGLSTAVLAAIADGETAENFAIGIVQAGKAGTRGERALRTAAAIGHPALAHMTKRTEGQA